MSRLPGAPVKALDAGLRGTLEDGDAAPPQSTSTPAGGGAKKDGGMRVAGGVASKKRSTAPSQIAIGKSNAQAFQPAAPRRSAQGAATPRPATAPGGIPAWLLQTLNFLNLVGTVVAERDVFRLASDDVAVVDAGRASEGGAAAVLGIDGKRTSAASLQSSGDGAAGGGASGWAAAKKRRPSLVDLAKAGASLGAKRKSALKGSRLAEERKDEASMDDDDDDDDKAAAAGKRAERVVGVGGVAELEEDLESLRELHAKGLLTDIELAEALELVEIEGLDRWAS